MVGIVTSPTASDVHVNRPLTMFSQKYLQDMDNFISLRAMPNLPVSQQSDLYYVYDRDDFYRDEAQERADGTESQGGSFTLSTEPYFTRVYAFHKEVTDRQRANQDAAVRLDESAAQYIAHKLMIRREKLFQDTYFKTGVWDTDDDTKNWAGENSDPIIDVRTAKRTIMQNTGYMPNKMILGRQSYDTLMDNDSILSRIVGGANNEVPAKVMRMLLASLFEIDEIFVMDAVNTTTVRGAATQSTSFIGGDNALLYYAPESVGLNEPTAGLQFSWSGYIGATTNGMRMSRFRNDLHRADRVEGEMAFDYKVTGSELGYFFEGVSS